MRKIYIWWALLALTVPLTTIAIVTPSTSLYRKSTVSGERYETGSTKTGTGKTRNIITGLNINAVKESARPKSRLETAAERQRQRQADLDKQHQEEQEQADRQRAIKAEYDAKKKAEEDARKTELQKQQDNESIEAYCARAERQDFLKSKWKVETIQQCIDKLNALKRLWKRIVQAGLKEAQRKKELSNKMKARCLDAITHKTPLPAYCSRTTENWWSLTGSTTWTGTSTTLR